MRFIWLPIVLCLSGCAFFRSDILPDLKPAADDRPWAGQPEAAIAYRITRPFRLLGDDDTQWFLPKTAEKGDFAAYYARLAADITKRGETPYRSVKNVLFPDGTAYDRAAYILPNRQTLSFKLNATAREKAELADNDQCTWEIVDENGAALPPTVPMLCSLPVQLDIPVDYQKASEQTATLRVRQRDRLVAEETISFRDKVVVSLGDSFASGEGNPDKPLRIKTPLYSPVFRTPNTRILDPQLLALEPAEWLVNKCDASMLSYPYFVAAHLAAAKPDESVTFISYACSGAEIQEGLLGEQFIQKNRGDVFSNEAQLTTLKRDFCLDDGKPCTLRRPIHQVLLSIGGNDVGFSDLVAWAAVPTSGVIADQINKEIVRTCPTTEQQAAEKRCHGKRVATLLIRELPKQLGRLKKELDTVTPEVPLAMNLYPAISGDSQHGYCGIESDTSRDRRLSGIMYAKPVAALSMALQFSTFAIRPNESQLLAEKISVPLNTTLAAFAAKNGWQSVSAHSAVFAARPWCTVEKDADVPYGSAYGVRGYPDISQWNPVLPRKNLVVTPNESAFTQWSGEYYRPWTTHKGAFHPTSEGHAVIAGAVYQVLTQPQKAQK